MHMRLVGPAILWLTLGGLLAPVAFGPAPAVAQSTLTVLPAPEVRSVVDRGLELEGQRRWGEALTLYEEALRAYPSQRDLEQRFEFARARYDLNRRYHDRSFCEVLVGMSEPDAVALYAETLLKIHTHYVDEPNWKQLVDRGTRTLSVAFSDEAFAAQHLRNVKPELVDQVRREVESRCGNFLIRNRSEARDAVAWAARHVQQNLGVSSTAIVLEYLCGATNMLDDYSSFLTSNQLTEVYSQIEGNFVGLGIELKSNDGALQILRVLPNSPAERGGIRAGDRIVAVDGHSTTAMNTDQAANLLQGKEGSLVEVNVLTPGQEPRALRLRREHVEVASVDNVKIVDSEFGIGYLHMACFQKSTPRDLETALWQLHRQGMKSLIIDLRGNPGGLLSASVEVVDKFVDGGRIVSTRGRSPAEDYNYSAHLAGTWRVPLVVLIDGDSASASEIFAGAIRDHQRGTLVGSRSYGKGSVQGIFPLGLGGAGIRLTTAKFYSPNGLPFSKVGVSPDVTVEHLAKPIDGQVATPTDPMEADAVLSAGLRAARSQLARR